jgi:hypothetical protein
VSESDSVRALPLTCGVLVLDKARTRASERVVFRTCGAPTNGTVEIGGDHLFAACSRHNRRLERLNERLRTR